MSKPNNLGCMAEHAMRGSLVAPPDAMAAFTRAQWALGRARRAQTAVGGTMFLLAVLGSLWVSEVSLTKVVEGFPGLVDYVAGTLPVIRPESVRADIAEWYWGLGRWLALLLDTLVIAFTGTLLGATSALVLGFPAARNLTPNTWVYSLCRRCLEIARTVPELVYALMFVNVVGLGPFAGVMAIAVSDTGTLAKLFAEAIENVDRRQIEGVRATGANRLQLMRFAIFPQVLPVMLSHALYYFESNTRSATILGVVGAGGIGLHLADRIRVNNWDEVSFLLLMILVVVTGIDLLSKTIRLRCIQAGTALALRQPPGA